LTRFMLLITAAAGLGACTGPTYSFEGPTLWLANERAARYCDEREAAARLEDIRVEGGAAVEFYHCIPRSRGNTS
jgi:hypothetical protein